MSGTDSMTNPPACAGRAGDREDRDPVAAVVPVARSQRVPRRPFGSRRCPFDTTSEPEDWPARGPAKGIRLGWPVAVLLVC